MKFDSSEAEITYSSINSGLTTFVMNTLGSYKDLTDQLQEQLKKITEQYNETKKELEELKNECKEPIPPEKPPQEG